MASTDPKPARRRSRAPVPPDADAHIDVGARLKQFRQAKSLTINRLSTLSGVPGSTISKIENGQLRPSLVHAINLAAALEENLAFLAGRYRDRPQPRSIVRAADRQTINYPELGFGLQDLSGQFMPGVLEARLGTLAPGAHSGSEPMTHRGEELCYVLEGSIRYRIAGGIDVETIELLPREYLQFKSSTPHAWENSHAGETQVLWVFSDGLSF